MSKVYKVVIIGFCHMHVNGVAEYFHNCPGTEIVAAADTEPVMPELNPDAMFARNWNKKHCQEAFKINKIYDNYIEMLDAEKPDLAVVTGENALHPEVVEECAKRGIDCNIEKPMAMSLQDGLRMWRAAESYGIDLIINWPVTFRPSINALKKLYEEGKIGKLIKFKDRTGSGGPLGAGSKHPGIEDKGTGITEPEKASTWWHQRTTGGGAMIDFCAYGGMLSTWYSGQSAVSVGAVRGNYTVQLGNADDEATIIARFPTFSAVIEGTWTSRNHCDPTGPILYGEKGVLWTQENGPHGYAPREDVVFFTGNDEIEEIPVAPLPEYMKDIAHHYVHHKETGAPLHETLLPKFNLKGLAIIDAGIRSADTGNMVLVNDEFYHIG